MEQALEIAPGCDWSAGRFHWQVVYSMCTSVPAPSPSRDLSIGEVTVIKLSSMWLLVQIQPSSEDWRTGLPGTEIGSGSCCSPSSVRCFKISLSLRLGGPVLWGGRHSASSLLIVLLIMQIKCNLDYCGLQLGSFL